MVMASEHQVKRYLAYWFQLGKKVLLRNGEAILPHPIIKGDHYSPEFEQCWQQILNKYQGECYLEGTNQTIQQLLTPCWEIQACPRCQMPVPMFDLGLKPDVCPCNDMLEWPNNELPYPRDPVDSKKYLNCLAHKLREIDNK